MHTVRALIDSRADARPNTTFQFAPEARLALTYSELRSIAHTIHRKLEALNVAEGDKVAFLMDNGHWTSALFLGVMYARRIIVPLNAVAGPEQLGHVLSHSDSKILFIASHYREQFASLLTRSAQRTSLIETDEDSGPHWPEPARSDSSKPVPRATPDDEALLIYTSGTTGSPKGVVLTHKNVIAGGVNTATAHELTDQDRALCVLPLYPINAEMVTLIGPLISGGSVVMPHRFSVTKFWHLISEYRCTWFSVVPTIISYLIEHDERSGTPQDFQKLRSHVKFGRSASSALPPATHRTFERRFGIPIIETMGITETSAQVFSNPLPPKKIKYGSPGIPFGNEAKVVNKDGHTAAEGEVGEIYIRGDNVMKGYYKDPQTTRRAIDGDGWFHTGDIGYRDGDGFYFITGRLKEIIIKGGENIAPREIDDVLYKHPDVLEAAAFGVPDARYGEDVMACVVLKSPATCSAAELEAFCDANLGSYKTPKRIFILDELPRGPSGKIQRLKLIDLISRISDS